MWMVRAGEGGFRFEDFKSGSRVSIGWEEMGDLSSLKSRDDFTRAVERTYQGLKKAQVSAYASQPYRFVREVRVGDSVVTYDSSARTYLLGTVTAEYQYAPSEYPEQPNIRRVKWRGEVPRDALSVATRLRRGIASAPSPHSSRCLLKLLRRSRDTWPVERPH
jgi:restriction system protein